MDDLIRRADAIRIASGYCHPANIQAELAKLPSVSTEKTAIDCSDSICRADAIKLVKSYIHEIITESGVDKNSHTNKILTDIVESLAFELPPVSVAEKTGRWIPVSERLPEDGIYLVTVEITTGVPRIGMRSFAKDLNRVDDFYFPEHKCGWYDYDSEYGYYEDTNVIAWQPLPQPYKGESEECE